MKRLTWIVLPTVFFLSASGAVSDEKKITIGGVEEIILLPWGARLPARIDTEAATSSLDARGVKVEDNIVEFRLPKQYSDLRLRLPVVMWHEVRGAEFTGRRPAIEIKLCIASRVLRAHVTLNDRSMVEYPLIIGRNVLEGNFVVDVERWKTATPSCPDIQGR